MTISVLSANTVFAADTGGYITANGNTLPVHVLQKAGNDNECFVILLLGDGFTSDEQNILIDNLSSRSDALLKTEPFRTYSHRINIYAVPTVSNEKGISISYGTQIDTYFGLSHYGNIANFGTSAGKEKAENIKKAFENEYLDNGATVGTIHILSNSSERFGTSIGPLYSFSPMYDLLQNETFIHEISHSIGKLGDEYTRISETLADKYSNLTTKTNPEEMPWYNLIGFRGIGYTPNPYDLKDPPYGYIPSKSCIMLDSGYGVFCEVCKLELAKNLNSYLYSQVSDDYYIADPDLTIEHSPNTLGSDYEKYRISNGNLIKANNHNLEFRTVVQNLTNSERHFKLVLKLIDENGDVKRSVEKKFTVAPLPDRPFKWDYAPAQQSLSVTMENVSGIVFGDTVSGEITDCDTNKIVATDKNEKQGRCVVNINHKIKNADGSSEKVSNTNTTKIYLPKGTIYKPTPPNQLNGLSYVCNSLGENEITLSADSIDIDYYYQKLNPSIAVQMSADKKTFYVTPHDMQNGNVIIIALYDNNALADIKTFVCDDTSNDAFEYTTTKNYSAVTVMAWDSFKNMRPLCEAVTK